MNQSAPFQLVSAALIANLVFLAKAYAEAKGLKMTTVGSNATGTMTFFTDLERGETSCTLRKYDLLAEWFATNWPAGKELPVPPTTIIPNFEWKVTHDQTKVRRRKSRSKERKKARTKKTVSKKSSSAKKRRSA